MSFNGKGAVAFHETSQMLWKNPIKKNCFKKLLLEGQGS